MSTRVQVVAAVIAHDGRFLVGKRSLSKASAPGYWTPIVGRIEAGESEEDAVAREVKEEVGLVVRALEKLVAIPTRDGSAVIHWWRTVIVGDSDARVMNDEHTELRWVSVEEMRGLDLVFPEDIEVFAHAELTMASHHARS